MANEGTQGRSDGVRSRSLRPVRRPVARERSFAKAEPLDEPTIALRVARLQIVEQLPPARDHAQQAATRVVILGVGLEMIRETVDARSEQRNLHFGRTGIACDPLMIGDDLSLILYR